MAVPITGGGAGRGGFQLSAGVNTSEIDLTNTIGAVSTTAGAMAGVFRWGPVEQAVLIDSENTLAKIFGKPTSFNAETWFTAANFAAYGSTLYVTRAANTSAALSAIANTGSVDISAHTVKNEDHFNEISDTFENDAHFIAKYPGDLGNSLKISICATANQYRSTVNLSSVASNTSFNTANTKMAATVGSNTVVITLANSSVLTSDTPLAHAQVVANLFSVGDYLEVGNSTIGVQYIKISNASSIAVVNTAGTNTGTARITLYLENKFQLSSDWSSNTVSRNWEYYNQVTRAPGTSEYVTNFGNSSAVDELHIAVVDQDGMFTGRPGTVLEVYEGLSRATDARASSSGPLYYKTVVNTGSPYIWIASDYTGLTANASGNVASASTTAPTSLSLAGGADGGDETDAGISFGDLARAWDVYAQGDSIDVSLLIVGKNRGTAQLANYVIDNVAEVRKDCVVFISPRREDVVGVLPGSQAENVVQHRNSLTGSSYAFMDSGYKYMNDKYNNVYRWVPLCGDTAGIVARSDSLADPWFSPAGPTRGAVKNVVKLAFPCTSKTDRDYLYKNGVNPVVTFQGQGTQLYGDKTLLKKTSAFDRINVRRLFITIEKALARAAQESLFEFNDPFTRAQFKNMVEPYLRDIQGRRGIYDFKVVCDETNNTDAVIDSNRFVGDIYIKPARAINFIQLNFVAVGTGGEFTEVAGSL
jgi:hypothetical protein